MNRTKILFKTMMKLYFSAIFKTEKAKVSAFLVFLAMLPIGALLLVSLSSLMSVAYSILEPANQQSLILAIAFLITGLLLLLLSVPAGLTAFYFSDDIENYLPMPFHPYQILIGKSLPPLLTTYALGALMLVPVLGIYGSLDGIGIFYIINSLFIFLLFPLIPFILSSLLVMFLMRFANISKNKDRIRVLAGVFSLAFVVGINVVVRLNTDSGGVAQETGKWMEQQDHFLWNITKILPNVYIGTKALSTSGWVSLLFLFLFILCTLVLVGLFIWGGQKLYYKGVLGLSGSGKGKVVANIEQTSISRSVIRTYTLKEIRTIFRTPAFFINCIVQGLFAPMLLLIILFMDDGLGSMAPSLSTMEDKSILLAAFFFSVFVLGSNPTASSAISRDGPRWFVNLYLPIQPLTIIYGKAIAAMIIEGITIIILTLLFVFFLPVPPLVITLWAILIVAASWFSSLIGIYYDLDDPKLEWLDEQEVFKTRFTPLISFVVQLFSLGCVVLVVWLLPFINNVWGVFLLMGITLAVAIWIADHRLQKKVKEQYCLIYEKQ